MSKADDVIENLQSILTNDSPEYRFDHYCSECGHDLHSIDPTILNDLQRCPNCTAPIYKEETGLDHE